MFGIWNKDTSRPQKGTVFVLFVGVVYFLLHIFYMFEYNDKISFLLQTTIEPPWAGSYRSTQIRSERGWFDDFYIKSRIEQNAVSGKAKQKYFLTKRNVIFKFYFWLFPSILSVEHSGEQKRKRRGGVGLQGGLRLLRLEQKRHHSYRRIPPLHHENDNDNSWFRAVFLHDIILSKKNALQFRVWRSICGLPPRARRQMSIEKKRDTIVIWKIYSLQY